MSSVLVTGGAGFIGANVVNELLGRGHSVIVADNLSKKESRMPDNVDFMNVDLADAAKAREAFQDADICINLASKIGGIGYFHKYPATIISENNKIYSSTFEAAVDGGVKRMVYISSSMVFESTDKFPSRESHVAEIPPPLTSYGMSKLIGEYYCAAFQKEFGLDFTIIRPFNAYGINEHPGDFVGYAHVIPDLIKKILSGQRPLTQTRCFTHVKDIARAIVVASESENAVNQDFNIGTSEETSMTELAGLLWQLCGRKEPFEVRHLPGFEHDIKRRVPDVSKARRLLGWEPLIPFDQGLKEVVSWLRNELD